jgi:hypothetical protein
MLTSVACTRNANSVYPVKHTPCVLGAFVVFFLSFFNKISIITDQKKKKTCHQLPPRKKKRKKTEHTRGQNLACNASVQITACFAVGNTLIGEPNDKNMFLNSS